MRSGSVSRRVSSCNQRGERARLLGAGGWGVGEASTQEVDAQQEFQILGYKHVDEAQLRDGRNWTERASSVSMCQVRLQ